MKLLLLMIFLVSCSTTNDNAFVDQVSPDLVETFQIKNEKFAKFVVAKTSSAPVTKELSISKKEKEKEKEKEKPGKKNKKKSKLKIKKKQLLKVISISRSKEVIEVPVPEAKELVTKEFPDDYPEELIELDKLSEATWRNYKPFYRIGEEQVFSISYLGITAGKIRFMTEAGLNIAGKDSLHFRALFKTSKFYKYIYEADDVVDTYVSADKFLPIKYTLIQRESSKDVDDLQLFDHEEHKTYLFYKKFKKKNNQTTKTEKEAYIPKMFQDFMSTLFFVRGLPLKKGDVYKFPVFTRGKFWRLTVKVKRVSEKIKVMGKWVKAIRLDTVALPPKLDKKKKKSTIILWYSNDANRIFLKLQAKLKFGSIEGEIEEHIPGRVP